MTHVKFEFIRGLGTADVGCIQGTLIADCMAIRWYPPVGCRRLFLQAFDPDSHPMEYVARCTVAKTTAFAESLIEIEFTVTALSDTTDCTLVAMRQVLRCCA